MATTQEKWQEIANRGLQDKFDPATRAKFDEAVNRGLITIQAPQQVQDVAPTVQVEQPQAEPSFGQQALGVAENIGALVSGAVAEPIAGVAGLAQSINPFAEQGAGSQAVQDVKEALTFQPRTEAGQSQQQALGQGFSQAGQAITENVLEPLGLDNLADKTLEATGSPLAATVVASLPTALSEVIPGGIALRQASKISKASPIKSKNLSIAALDDTASDLVKKSFKKKLGNDRFEPRIFNMVKATRKQGFDDSVTTMIANANPTTRKRMLKQVGIVEAGKGDAKAKALTRTADEAGGALVQQIDFAKAKNKQAGAQLGEIATRFKDDKVNMVEPVNEFIRSMDEQLGVKFEKNMKPIFEGSDIETFPESRKLVNDLALKIKRTKSPTALDAHKFKRLIDKSVTYGKSDGRLDSDLEHIAKTLRGNINNKLSAKYPEYKQANKQFSETITVLDDLQSVAGRKLDFSGKHANKAAGTLLRSQTNNTKGRANLLTAIEELELTTNKYGGKFDDDILALSIFADELDAVFGSGARTSLRGEVGKGVGDAVIDISQMTGAGMLATGAKAVTKRVRGVNEANQLKSIKALLRQ